MRRSPIEKLLEGLVLGTRVGRQVSGDREARERRERDFGLRERQFDARQAERDFAKRRATAPYVKPELRGGYLQGQDAPVTFDPEAEKRREADEALTKRSRLQYGRGFIQQHPQGRFDLEATVEEAITGKPQFKTIPGYELKRAGEVVPPTIGGFPTKVPDQQVRRGTPFVPGADFGPTREEMRGEQSRELARLRQEGQAKAAEVRSKATHSDRLTQAIMREAQNLRTSTNLTEEEAYALARERVLGAAGGVTKPPARPSPELSQGASLEDVLGALIRSGQGKGNPAVTRGQADIAGRDARTAASKASTRDREEVTRLRPQEFERKVGADRARGSRYGLPEPSVLPVAPTRVKLKPMFGGGRPVPELPPVGGFTPLGTSRRRGNTTF